MVDIRSSQPAVAHSFDLHNQTGIAELLVAIRTSAMDIKAKNELRDLVFQFSSSREDDALRSLIERKISEYKLEPRPPKVLPVTKTELVVPPRVLPFGSVRPRPAFKLPPLAPVLEATSEAADTATADSTAAQTDQKVNTVTDETIQTSSEVALASNDPSVFTPHVQSPTTSVDQVPTETTSAPSTVDVSDVPSPALSPQIEPPVPESPSSVSDTPVDPVTVSVPVSTTVGEPVTPPTPISGGATPDLSLGSPDLTEKNLNRIREIKAQVNEQIGNPVNLVDINNQVGREYMSALLDAMKKINSGMAGVAAMNRLEASYQAVIEVLKNRSVTPAPQASPAASPLNPPSPVAPAVEESVVPTPPEPLAEPAKAVVNLPPVASTPLQSVMMPPPPPHPASVAPQPPSVEVGSQSAAVSPAVADRAMPAVIPPILPQSPTSVSNAPVVSSTSTPVSSQQVPQPTNQPDALSPITKTAPRPLSPMDLKDPTSLDDSSVKGDPLFTREVDDGLNQLLSEWSLFKKSGLFGTGPKGTEHPLFKKVSNLQIPLLLAGRFEGATQEIKQSITDYMNGWRYEQGIIYEQGETFEHYLRRVIKHIIDLQKKRTAA